MKRMLLGTLTALLTFVLLSTQTSCTKDELKEIIKTDTLYIPTTDTLYRDSIRIDTLIKTDTLYRDTITIEGLWTGSQVNTNGDGQAFSFSIMKDGTASYENVVLGVYQLCVGSWRITDGKWICNTTCIYGAPVYVGAQQTFTADYDAATGKMTNGTYVTTTPGIQDSGTFVLTEVR